MHPSSKTIDNKNDAPFILISGCPRTGTTLMANWLASVLAPSWLTVRESGISLVAHQCFHVAEYNVKNHAFAYKFNQDSEPRLRFAEGIKGMAQSLYASIGWSPGQAILDKQPYTLPDGCRYFQHLLEAFPTLKIIYMVREPQAVIRSMMARKWGRGPFPRSPFSSPFTYAFSDSENSFGDIYPDNPGEPNIATGPRTWSAQKSIKAYRNALNGYLSAGIDDHSLVVDYDLLPLLPWHRAISKFIGEEIPVGCPFRRSTSEVSLDRVQDDGDEDIEIADLYSLLRQKSLDGFAKWSS